mmetsp:Transcript_10033/g.40827  ORF Transcript_10033/g.40827 Transcript_10033/m.40827 type:complete len:441 (-) Transcript_10033:76-1398(-)
MAHGVLDQRLQQQRRQTRRVSGRVQVPDHAQPLAKADLLDRQVALGQLDLLGQRDGGAGIGQGHAEQFGQVFQHALGAGRVDPHQRDGAVQRVEQEMRVQLAADGRQLGLGQRALGLSGGDGRGARHARLQHRGEGRGQRGIHHQAPDRAPQQARQQHGARMAGAEQRHVDDELARLPQRREAQARQRVRQAGGCQAGIAGLQAPHQRPYGRAQQHGRPQHAGGLVDRQPERIQAAVELTAGQHEQAPGQHAAAGVGQPQPPVAVADAGGMTGRVHGLILGRPGGPRAVQRDELRPAGCRMRLPGYRQCRPRWTGRHNSPLPPSNSDERHGQRQQSHPHRQRRQRPRDPLQPQRWRLVHPESGDDAQLEEPRDRRAPGRNRMAPRRLQRPPGRDRRRIRQEGPSALRRRPAEDPQMAGQGRPRHLHHRNHRPGDAAARRP